MTTIVACAEERTQFRSRSTGKERDAAVLLSDGSFVVRRNWNFVSRTFAALSPL
jgi:hypothetical protein